MYKIFASDLDNGEGERLINSERHDDLRLHRESVITEEDRKILKQHRENYEQHMFKKLGKASGFKGKEDAKEGGADKKPARKRDNW